MRSSAVLCCALIGVLAGCSHADQEKAREKADEAREKTATTAKKLGNEAKADAQELNAKIRKSLDGQHPPEGGTSPEEKLNHATDVAREEGRKAGMKLGHAGMLAKVKAKLANDVGLATVSTVNVDVDGSVVTLSGTVSSEDQKRQAERAVSSVDGVTQVVNRLTVQP
jgi:cell division septum initiation protein DivIVA